MFSIKRPTKFVQRLQGIDGGTYNNVGLNIFFTGTDRIKLRK